MRQKVSGLDRLSFLEPEGKVGYRHGENGGRQTFVAARPPPPQAAFQDLLLAADPPVEYFP